MDLKLLPLYFFVGGLIVALTVYFGSRGNGTLAALINLFPGITIITFAAIYFHGGAQALLSFSRGMLILLPAWILYLLGVYFLFPRLGLVFTLIISVAVFLVVSLLISRYT